MLGNEKIILFFLLIFYNILIILAVMKIGMSSMTLIK